MESIRVSFFRKARSGNTGPWFPSTFTNLNPWSKEYYGISMSMSYISHPFQWGIPKGDYVVFFEENTWNKQRDFYDLLANSLLVFRLVGHELGCNYLMVFFDSCERCPIFLDLFQSMVANAGECRYSWYCDLWVNGYWTTWIKLGDMSTNG